MAIHGHMWLFIWLYKATYTLKYGCWVSGHAFWGSGDVWACVECALHAAYLTQYGG